MSRDPVLIAVLGITGVGKSTFVNKATGVNLRVGPRLDPATKGVRTAKCTIDGQEVVVLDTAGFDDYERTDVDVLGDIAMWLGDNCSKGVLLAGIILLQSSTGITSLQADAQRMRLFEKVCGPNAFGNVIIIRNMWSGLRDRDFRLMRTEEPDFWNSMSEKGAQVREYENTTESAHEILRLLVKNRKSSV